MPAEVILRDLPKHCCRQLDHYLRRCHSRLLGRHRNRRHHPTEAHSDHGLHHFDDSFLYHRLRFPQAQRWRTVQSLHSEPVLSSSSTLTLPLLSFPENSSRPDTDRLLMESRRPLARLVPSFHRLYSVPSKPRIILRRAAQRRGSTIS